MRLQRVLLGLVVVVVGFVQLFVGLRSSTTSNEHEVSYQNDIVHLTQQQPSTARSNNKETLVVFSGPTVLENLGHNRLYLQNLNYFLHYGIDCQEHDTVISLTNATEPFYRQRIALMNRECSDRGIQILIRRPDCFDMETMRMLLHDGHFIDHKSYKYLVYVNCGMTGPAPYLRTTWTHLFTSLLSEEIKMVGLSLNCGIMPNHIQSFVYAMDQRGLEITKKAGCFYDCLQHKSLRKNKNMTKRKLEIIRFDVIYRYEIALSREILKAGFGITALQPQRMTLFSDNETTCTNKDMWYSHVLRRIFHKNGGALPPINRTLFYKSSRIASPEVEQLLESTSPGFDAQVSTFLSKRRQE